MKLLIDVGNSLIKWAVVKENNFLSQGSLSHLQVSKLAEIFHNEEIDSIYGSIVASNNLRENINQICPIKIKWIGSERSINGLHNYYYNIEEHGSDRWLAVLALYEKKLGDVVLASLGTALTIEALTAEGDYLGGTIAPGIHLMTNSLANGTARLNQLSGAWSEFPKSTADAIMSGTLEAIIGAIERMRERLSKRTNRKVSVVLTGGDAVLLAPLLTQPCHIMDNLVIQGLLKVSNRI